MMKMRILITFLLIVHGLIHLFGFLKAYNIYQFEQLTQSISRPQGVLWLLTALLFGAAAAFYLGNASVWWGIAFAGVLLSQVLIIGNWPDAQFGTVANLILLVAALLSWQAQRFAGQYQSDARTGLERTQSIPEDTLTEADLQHLPAPVQRYLQYVGAVGQPKVHSIRVQFDAEMRGKGQDWFAMNAEQYNFFDTDERLFFLKAKVKGLPAQGYHLYRGHDAKMDVRVFSVFPVAQAEGAKMFEAETVTMFNDMCFLAPATLIDKRIKWEPVDDRTVKAAFTNKGVTIRAKLFFNEAGQLINFESHDRYDVNAGKKYKFTTPLTDYRSFGNRRGPAYGEAVWHYPDGPFVYGKFKLKDIVVNPAVAP